MRVLWQWNPACLHLTSRQRDPVSTAQLMLALTAALQCSSICREIVEDDATQISYRCINFINNNNNNNNNTSQQNFHASASASLLTYDYKDFSLRNQLTLKLWQFSHVRAVADADIRLGVEQFNMSPSISHWFLRWTKSVAKLDGGMAEFSPWIRHCVEVLNKSTITIAT